MDHIGIDRVVGEAAFCPIPGWKIRGIVVDGVLGIEKVTPWKTKLLSSILP